MSRSGFSDDYWDGPGPDPWPGIIKRTLRGKRSQAFLRELLATLDAMPVKELIPHELIDATGAVCAIGSVGKARGIDMTKLDVEDPEQIAKAFGVAPTLVSLIESENDEDFIYYRDTTPAQRWQNVRAWVVFQLQPPPSEAGGNG